MHLLVVSWVVLAVVASFPDIASGTVGEAVATSESIPFKEESPVTVGSIQRIALVLLFVIGIGIAATLVLRKQLEKRGLLGLPAGDRITVEATRRIAPRLSVYLINIDKQGYVVVQSGSDIQLTPHSLPDSSIPPEPELPDV